MPIITKPGTVEKGSEAVFTLDKTALAALSVVSADEYFSVITNWSKVEMFFKSPTGNQMEVVTFDPSLASPVGKFLVSETARDVFEIDKIIIYDFDGGNFLVKRENLTIAEFDINFIPAPPALSGTYIDWTERLEYTTEADGGLTSTLIGPDSSTASLIYGDNTTKNPVTAPFSLVYKLNKVEFINQDQRFLGITGSGKSTYTGFYKDVSTGPNNITFLVGNVAVETLQINAFSDPAITVLFLKMAISENGVEYFVNDVKLTQFISSGYFSTAGEMIPTARVYDGMEVLETYFE